MPGLTPNSITQLYKTYGIGTPDQPLIDALMNGTGKYAKYNTPESLTGLLSATQSDRKSKMIQTANNNIQQLGGAVPGTPQSLYGGKLPDYQTFEAGNAGVQNAQAQYDQSSQDYGSLATRAATAPSRTRESLKAGSFFLGETRADLEKKYGDPTSPWFVPDTQTRDKVLNNTLDSRNQTMQDIVSKVTDLYSVLTEAGKNEMAGKKDQLENLRRLTEKSYESLMSYYGQQQADEVQAKRDKEQHDFTARENALDRRNTNNNRAPRETPDDKFRADANVEAGNVLAGKYGKTMAREAMIQRLTLKYPNRAEEIKDLVYGKRTSTSLGGGQQGPTQMKRVGGIFEDGYESRIQDATKMYGDTTGGTTWTDPTTGQTYQLP